MSPEPIEHSPGPGAAEAPRLRIRPRVEARRRARPDLLTELSGPIQAVAVTPYEACDFSCRYCITGQQGTSTPTRRREEIRPEIAAFARQVPVGRRFAVGPIADAYPEVEETLGLSREAISTLNDLGRPLSVTTKGLAVRRDFDLLAENPDSCLAISLTTTDPGEARKLEPRVASPNDRIALALESHAARIRTRLAVTYVPGVTDLDRILDLAGPLSVFLAPLNVTAPAIRHTSFAKRHDQDALALSYRQALAAYEGRVVPAFCVRDDSMPELAEAASRAR